MADSIRAALERLVKASELVIPMSHYHAFEFADAIAAGKAALAEPTPPAEGEVGELLAELEVAAVTVESEGGDHEAAAVRRAAELLQQRHPEPVPVSERLPGPEEMDGSLVWCGSQAAGLPYWEWCLDDIRHPGSSGYTHWLPANTPALPTALPLPQGEVEG